MQLVAALLAAAALAGAARAQAAAERVVWIDMLDNGSGSEAVDAPAGDPRRTLVPWWVASGAPRTEPAGGDGLVLAPGAVLEQPLAAYEPFAARTKVSGRVEGEGLVRLVDGSGDALELFVQDQPFELDAADFARRFAHAPMPRFVLELSAPAGSRGARFTGLRALAAWPCPERAALAAELAAHMDLVVRTWTERGTDRDGPRATAFLTRRFDVVTGAKIDAGANCLHPLYESLAEVCASVDMPAWHAALEAYLADFFELGFHPATGLPRDWDGESDLPQDAKPVEIARYLALLLDLEARGPTAFRERALAQAQRIAATVLERGQLPDGSLATKFRPADAAPDLDVPPLRKLDVAAQFARLSRRTGDERYVEAARVALAALEFTHLWAGSWFTIDPEFDDSYGHWGSRAATMLAAFPEDREFRRFNADAFRHFAPLWRDALRFGGSMASDQNRCWELADRYAAVEPAIRPELDLLLRDSIRAHLKGRQYANGSWGDVTFMSFSPRASMNIGDLTGYPANVLHGLAVACRPGSALRTDATRALFTAVLRQSESLYRRPYGLLLAREQAPGRNVAGADIRLFAAGVEMLKHLAP